MIKQRSQKASRPRPSNEAPPVDDVATNLSLEMAKALVKWRKQSPDSEASSKRFEKMIKQYYERRPKSAQPKKIA
jgi:hypothetical protein